MSEKYDYIVDYLIEDNDKLQLVITIHHEDFNLAQAIALPDLETGTITGAIIYIASKLEMKMRTGFDVRFGVTLDDIDELEEFLHSIKDTIKMNAELALSEHTMNKQTNYINYSNITEEN